jgi:hypothetical protein
MGLVIDMGKNTCIKIMFNDKVAYLKILTTYKKKLLIKADKEIHINRITDKEFEEQSKEVEK